MGYTRKMGNRRAAAAKANRRGRACPYCGRRIKGPAFWGHIERCGERD